MEKIPFQHFDKFFPNLIFINHFDNNKKHIYSTDIELIYLREIFPFFFALVKCWWWWYAFFSLNRREIIDSSALCFLNSLFFFINNFMQQWRGKQKWIINNQWMNFRLNYILWHHHHHHHHDYFRFLYLVRNVMKNNAITKC